MMAPYSPPRLAAEALLEHARATAPRECAGTISGGQYRPQAEGNADSVRLAGWVGEDTEAVCHSHVGGLAYPSLQDMAAGIALGRPVVIVCLGDDEVVTYDPAVPPDPVGAGYRFGISDCWSAIRFGFADRGVALPDLPRTWQDWREPGIDSPYLLEAGRFGFRPCSDPHPLDVAVMRPGRGAACHAALLLEDGETILHHPGRNRPVDLGALGRREPLGRWRRHIVGWFRLA